MTYIREHTHNNILTKRVKGANTPHFVPAGVRFAAVEEAADA